MLTSEPIVASAEALVAVKDHLRVEHGDADATLASLTAAAIASCEVFTGEVQVERGFTETLDASTGWAALSAVPVVAITSVAGTGQDQGGALALGGFEIDIASDGTGRVRLTSAAPARLTIGYRAGRASGWGGVREPIRLGIVRYAAQLYAARDASGDDVPLPTRSVRALWQGARRMRMA